MSRSPGGASAGRYAATSNSGTPGHARGDRVEQRQGLGIAHGAGRPGDTASGWHPAGLRQVAATARLSRNRPKEASDSPGAVRDSRRAAGPAPVPADRDRPAGQCLQRLHPGPGRRCPGRLRASADHHPPRSAAQLTRRSDRREPDLPAPPHRRAAPPGGSAVSSASAASECSVFSSDVPADELGPITSVRCRVTGQPVTVAPACAAGAAGQAAARRRRSAGLRLSCDLLGAAPAAGRSTSASTFSNAGPGSTPSSSASIVPARRSAASASACRPPAYRPMASNRHPSSRRGWSRVSCLGGHHRLVGVAGRAARASHHRSVATIRRPSSRAASAAPRLGGEFPVRIAAPELQCLVQQRPASRAVPLCSRGAAHQRLEPPGVHRVRRHPDRIAGRLADQDGRPVCAAPGRAPGRAAGATRRPAGRRSPAAAARRSTDPRPTGRRTPPALLRPATGRARCAAADRRGRPGLVRVAVHVRPMCVAPSAPRTVNRSMIDGAYRPYGQSPSAACKCVASGVPQCCGIASGAPPAAHSATVRPRRRNDTQPPAERPPPDPDTWEMVFAHNDFRQQFRCRSARLSGTVPERRPRRAATVVEFLGNSSRRCITTMRPRTS